MARSARISKPPASGLGPTTRRLRSQTKDTSPLRAGLSPPKRTTRQTRARKSATAPSEPSPPTTAESENNTEAENTETEAEAEAEVEAQDTTVPNGTEAPVSQSDEEQSEGETPRSKEQLQSSSSHNASTGTELPSSEANTAAQTTVSSLREQTAAASMESIAVQTTPGLVRGQPPAESLTDISPRTRNPGITFHYNNTLPLDPGISPAQQERDPKTLEFAYPISQLYKLTKADLIEIIRVEREKRIIERTTFANDRSHLTRLETENRALKLSLHKKRARSDEEDEDSTSERPAVRRRLNSHPQQPPHRRRSSLKHNTTNRRDPHITRLLFGSTFRLGPESTSEEEDSAQTPQIEDTPKAQGPHLFPDTGSTKYILGNAERFEKNEDENKENDAEAATLDASQVGPVMEGATTQLPLINEMWQTSNESTESPTEQPPEPPGTPATNKWGVRSFLGSVSRYIPGLRGATPRQNQTTDSAPSASQSSQREPSQSQQAKSDVDSATPDTMHKQAQRRAQQSANKEDNQKTPSARGSSKPQVSQTEPAKRQSQPTASGPATERRRAPRQRRNADAQHAAVKAKEQERADHKARAVQHAHEAEESKQTKEEAEKAQQVGQKRKVRIDDLKVIPAGPPGTYGMVDKYFEQGSDSEDDYIELDDASIIEQDRPAKRVRMEEPASIIEQDRLAKRVRREEPASGKINSPSLMKTPTPAPRQIAGDRRHAQVYAGKLFAETDKTTYQGGNAFKQLTGEAAASPDTPTRKLITPRPLDTPRASDTPRSSNFNWAGHFAVPDSSDSESGEEEDEMQVESPVGDKKTEAKESITKPSAVSSSADDFLATLRNDQARKQREMGRQKHEAKKLAASSTPTTNIFASAQKNETVTPGPATATSIPSVTPSSSISTFAPPAPVAPSPSPQKQAAPPSSNHQVPPRPTPLHVSLPAITTTTVPATSAANVDSEALARARSAAEKYKPKVPSRLQASSRLSTSTVGNDVGDADDVAADVDKSVESSIDTAKQIEDSKSQPAHGQSSEAASFMKPAPAEAIEAAAPSVKAIEAVTGTNATGSAHGLNSEAAVKSAPAQAVEAGLLTPPAPFTSSISLPDLASDDKEVSVLIDAMPGDGLLANFDYEFPMPEDIEMDDVVRDAVEEVCQGDEWERGAAEEFEKGYKEWFAEMTMDRSFVAEGEGHNGMIGQPAPELSRTEGALGVAEVGVAQAGF